MRMFFRCPSISWFQVVSERLIHLFLQLGHLRVFQIIFQVIFLFSIFWKHHEDDTNVLPYCTIIVDSKGGWPCEKAWYSKCLYLMVCNEIEKGLHHPLVETSVIYIFFILDLWRYPASRYYQLCCKYDNFCEDVASFVIVKSGTKTKRNT